MKKSLDSIISVKEAALLWGYSPGHIKNLCAKGKINAKKIGKTWVIDHAIQDISKKTAKS